MLDHLAPAKPPEELNGRADTTHLRMRRARAKLRAMEQDQAFRDMVWNNAVIKTDLASGEILDGIVAKAKRGRVDAARLAMEITRRHVPKGDQTAPNVVVSINGVPRPGQVEAQTIEGEVISEDD